MQHKNIRKIKTGGAKAHPLLRLFFYSPGCNADPGLDDVSILWLFLYYIRSRRLCWVSGVILSRMVALGPYNLVRSMTKLLIK